MDGHPTPGVAIFVCPQRRRLPLVGAVYREDMSQDFVERAEHIIDALMESEPLLAQEVGDHRFDDKIEDLSADGVAARVSMLTDASNALADVDTDALSRDEYVDWEALSNAVAQRLFMLTEVKEHEWDVLRHSPAPFIEPLLHHPHISAEERLSSLLGRLEAIPDAAAASKQTLTRVPKLHAVLGAAQYRSTSDLVRTEVAALAREVPGIEAKAAPIIEAAADAMTDFAGWLDRTEAGHSPRLGRKLWEGKLWLTLDTHMSATDILDKTSRWIAELTTRLTEVAKQYLAENNKTADGDVIDAAFALAAQMRASDDTIVDMARSLVDEATLFTTDNNLVSLIDRPLRVTRMPRNMQGITAAYYEQPGAFELDSPPGQFHVSTAPGTWGPAQTDSFYRENNAHMLRCLAVHEVTPGHHLQAAHARQYRGATRTRAVCGSGTFVEGWAVYVEELLATKGFGGTAYALHQWKRQLRMVVDAAVDQLAHCEDLSGADAADLFQTHGRLPLHAAESQWARALLSSTQLSTYFVGYSEMSAIAYSRPKDTPQRLWHDRMLSQGTVAPRHLAALLDL